MKTKIYSLLLAMMSALAFAQSGWVGINTPNPQANLDVNGTMKIRQTPAAPTLPGYQILAVNKIPVETLRSYRYPHRLLQIM
jgi:flagellar basal body rod protein FlgG